MMFARLVLPILYLAAALALCAPRLILAANPRVDYVIHISVDGLRGSVIEELGPANLPNFYQLRAEGVTTDNARTLYENTVTLPNHVTVITGRPRDGANGHHVIRNSDPGSGGPFVPGGVDITTAAGEFVRGTGALRIDDGSGANYVHVNGNVVVGTSGSITSTVMSWYRYTDIDSDGSDIRNFLWETGPADYTLSFGIRSDTGDGNKHAQWFTKDPSTGGNAAGLPIVSDGQWHHAAVVIDESNQSLRYYHDGVQVDQATIPGLSLVAGNGSKEFFIGNHRSGDGSRNWDGFIDDMAVINGLASAGEIAAIYHGTQTVSQVAGANLVAHWTFDSNLTSAVNNNLYEGAAIVATSSGATVHSDCAAAGGDPYVHSVFDVVHDHGKSTALYAGWNGFNFLDTSWDEDSGTPDTSGADDGPDKIDTYHLVTNDNINAQNTAFMNDMTSDPYTYALMHWHLTDAVGHSYGWESQEYKNAVQAVDAELGRLIEFIKNDPELAGSTAVLLTADHGGYGTGHGDITNPEIYTIPFYVWLAGEQIGEDLYALNSLTRKDPGNGRPDYTDPYQPIRHGDATNLALDLLGLGPIPGSSMNALQDLSIVKFLRGDFNDDGAIDATDWLQFLIGHGGNFTGMSVEEAYTRGDLDGDFDNDLDDFILFFNAYEKYNGEGSFAALGVPEPSSLAIAISCSCPLMILRLLVKKTCT